MLFNTYCDINPYGQYWNRPRCIDTVYRVSILSGQYWNCLDSIETVWTVLKLSRRCIYCPETNSSEPSILPGYGLHCADKRGPFRLPLYINHGFFGSLTKGIFVLIFSRPLIHIVIKVNYISRGNLCTWRHLISISVGVFWIMWSILSFDFLADM